MAQDGISETELKEALLRGATTPDGQEVVWREKDGVRVVILRKPTPFKRGYARDDNLPRNSSSEGTQAVGC